MILELMITPETQAGLVRCDWAQGPLSEQYHDEEWGVPSHDERHLFEMLILEGAQAGLSWSTILNRRERYRRAYDAFDPGLVARYGDAKRAALLSDAGIIRNRAKVDASIANARAFLRVAEEFGSFDAFLWRFVDGRPITNRWESLRELPASTALSDKLSKELKRRGFSFAGSTICYSFMQAVGLVNDHLISCFRHEQVQRSVS